jgi:hypothetical protein
MHRFQCQVEGSVRNGWAAVTSSRRTAGGSHSVYPRSPPRLLISAGRFLLLLVLLWIPRRRQSFLVLPRAAIRPRHVRPHDNNVIGLSSLSSAGLDTHVRVNADGILVSWHFSCCRQQPFFSRRQSMARHNPKTTRAFKRHGYL